jgi:hypothetical protein
MWKEIAIGAIGSLIAAEAYMWVPALSVGIVRLAASRLPRMSDRMLEEWLADLQEIPGHFGKVAFAFSLAVRWRGIVDALPNPKMEDDLYVELKEDVVVSTVITAVATSVGGSTLSGVAVESWPSALIAGAYGRSDSTMRRRAAFLTTVTPTPLCLVHAADNKGESS